MRYEIGKLILTLFNLFPDNICRFLLHGLTDMMSINKSLYADNFRHNADLMINILKNEVEKESNRDNMDIQELYRSVSSIMGAFIGDAMGFYVEFKKPSERNKDLVWGDINFTFNTTKGQVTDDSEMALSLLFALNENDSENSDLDRDLLAFYYGLWFFSNPFDIGNSTRASLAHFYDEGVIEDLHSVGYFLTLKYSQKNYKQYYQKCNKASDKYNGSSLSNGILMRHTPMAVFLYSKFNKVIKDKLASDKPEDISHIFDVIRPYVEKDVLVTHVEKETIEFTLMYDLIIFSTIYFSSNSSPGQESYKKFKTYFDYFYKETVSKEHGEDILECFHKTFIFLQKLDDEIDYENGKELIKSLNMGVNHIGFFLHSFELCIFYLKYFDVISKIHHQTKYMKYHV